MSIFTMYEDCFVRGGLDLGDVVVECCWCGEMLIVRDEAWIL